MLTNVGENIKNNFAVIFFYTMDIKNAIFNPKFYQHFSPSLVIRFGLDKSLSEHQHIVNIAVHSKERVFYVSF